MVREAVAPNLSFANSALGGDSAPFSDRVRALLVRLAENAAKLPVGAVAKIVVGESRNFPELARVWHDEVASTALGSVARLIEDGQRRGERRARAVHP